MVAVGTTPGAASSAIMKPAPRLGIMMFPVGTVRVLRLTTFKTSGVARLAHKSPATITLLTQGYPTGLPF